MFSSLIMLSFKNQRFASLNCLKFGYKKNCKRKIMKIKVFDYDKTATERRRSSWLVNIINQNDKKKEIKERSV